VEATVLGGFDQFGKLFVGNLRSIR
jgi:hypothetical protein